MGDLIRLKPELEDDSDILTDIYIGLNLSAGDLGYKDDRLGWLRRLEGILSAKVHGDYAEFTEELWDS